MADSRSPWLWGCGLGCGALIILAVVLATSGVMVFRDTFSGFERAVEARQELERKFGRVESYTPEAGGHIAPERIQAFLEVRRSSQEQREKIASFFDRIPGRQEAEELEEAPFLEQLSFALSMARGGIGLGGDMGNFFEARNRALLEQQMGLGEYGYIYKTVYYSWLKKSPEDGPGTSSAEVDMGDFSFGRLRRDWVDALERASDAAEVSPEATELQVELEKLRGDENRIPWADGLPAEMVRAFEPFRAELEESYLPTTNPFELIITEKEGRFSYTTK